METSDKARFIETYHDNCHDYLKTVYLSQYTMPGYLNIITNIKKSIPIIHICDETSDQLYGHTIVCDQHGVIFSHYQDIYPILATYALNACLGLILYIPKLKIGCVAHFDGLPAYSKESAQSDGIKLNFDPVTENIKIILGNIRLMAPKVNRFDIDVYLIGGMFNLSEIMINDMINCIKKFNGKIFQFNFKGRNLLGPENQTRNICLDTATGKITHFDFLTNLEVHKNNLNQNNLPMNIIKAPRKSEAFLDITYRAHVKLNY